MPIGVPKVDYRLPGEPESDWIDLYNCLYRERMLFLCQDLGDEVANQLISLMLYLNAEDPSQPFFMYINSLGGSVTCGIGVYDIMRYLESGITTICMGTASSMASFILAGGTYGRRLSLPHGRIMIHQPEGGSDGQASEIVSESSEVNRIRKQIGLIYANRTQQSIERIARDLDRDQFMSADEAKSYGLIDFVARTSNTPDVDMDILKLLTDAPTAPKQFRDLAASQSMEQAKIAIRNLPEAAPSTVDPFSTYTPNESIVPIASQSESLRESPIVVDAIPFDDVDERVQGYPVKFFTTEFSLDPKRAVDALSPPRDSQSDSRSLFDDDMVAWEQCTANREAKSDARSDGDANGLANDDPALLIPDVVVVNNGVEILRESLREAKHPFQTRSSSSTTVAPSTGDLRDSQSDAIRNASYGTDELLSLEAS